MDKVRLSFDVYADRNIPPHLQPLVALWYVPEANTNRLFVAKAQLAGMQVVFDRILERGAVGLDTVEALQVALMDNAYERLIAFVGISPSLTGLTGEAPALP